MSQNLDGSYHPQKKYSMAIPAVVKKIFCMAYYSKEISSVGFPLVAHYGILPSVQSHLDWGVHSFYFILNFKLMSRKMHLLITFKTPDKLKIKIYELLELNNTPSVPHKKVPFVTKSCS